MATEKKPAKKTDAKANAKAKPAKGKDEKKTGKPKPGLNINPK